MNICVVGLGHLGLVTAKCLAHVGHNVVGCGALQTFPIEHEPGLAELPNPPLVADLWANAMLDADIVWLTMDTPVKDEVADLDAVLGLYRAAMPFLRGKVVINSSQLPVGWTRRMAEECGHRSAWACIPENLRMGKAVEVFLHPDRVVVGTEDAQVREIITELFAPITSRLEFMSIESAEMVKHAINALLATEVTFINEIAALCEKVGADPKDVERGLKTESRIGPGAYLRPGGPYSGEHLGRDIRYLEDIGRRETIETALISGVRWSNAFHVARETRGIEDCVIFHRHEDAQDCLGKQHTCRTHGTTFDAPNPCPKGRGAQR
jgi:UDPglucose 6-dehydrogenase